MWYMTEERELMRNVAREFVEQEVKPVALELDKNDEFPLQLLKRAGELDFWVLLSRRSMAGWAETGQLWPW